MPTDTPVIDALHAAALRIAVELEVDLCDDCGMPSPHHLDVCVYVRRHTEKRIAQHVELERETCAEIAALQEGYPMLAAGECGCGDAIAAKIRSRRPAKEPFDG
jgi:hypothetical protein